MCFFNVLWTVLSKKCSLKSNYLTALTYEPPFWTCGPFYFFTSNAVLFSCQELKLFTCIWQHDEQHRDWKSWKFWLLLLVSGAGCECYWAPAFINKATSCVSYKTLRAPASVYLSSPKIRSVPHNPENTWCCTDFLTFPTRQTEDD